ncbi:MAG TPA: hypothetical protein VLE27_10605 [Thermoanaerobaculia bacterium]|nr:hypothetical protein [Thermoanaerobaculia bacterium]
MGATMKKISVILLLVAFLTPGLAQAQVFGFGESAFASATDTGFFDMVWNLLANMLDKNGSQLDPSGCTNPAGCDDGSGAGSTGTTTTIFNGSQLDPSGEPK